MSTTLRSLRLPLLTLGLAASAACAGAAEHGGHTTAKAASASDVPAVSAPKVKSADAVPEEGRSKAAPKPDPAQDPMDRLRERLAQKLGATKAPGAENPNVLRVISKAGSVAAGEHDNPAAPAHGAVLRRAAVRPAAGAARSMSGVEPGHAHWDYAGPEGPAAWAQIKPEFSKCASGTRQSPIDIREGIRVDLEPVAFDYKAGGFKVVDDGHTVQVDVAPGNSIEVMGRRYDLIQFHFHRPSEERIDGRQFDMVAHLVHRDLEGHLAVIAVLLERGSALQAVQNVWNNLPLEKGDAVVARTLLDPSEMLPTDRRYYTYMGSLTTPPCSEGVLWMVMKTPLPISAEQIGIFARLYPMNARPIQSAGGRLVKESN